MVTAEELTVAIKSQGVNETKSDLQGVEESMSDTAESAGSSAEQLQGFSERFAGAMTAAVGALALGAAGLLSQVPVLGEAFSGLSAIVDAVALKMDSVLRPAISDVTNTLFEIANAIFEADGGMGKLIGRLGVVASLAGLVAGALAAVGVTLTGPILLAIAGAAAAVAALWTAWETNFANIRGVVESTVNAIRSRLQKFISVVGPIVQGFLNRLEKFWDNNGDAIISAVNFALRVVGTAFEQAFDAILTVVQAGLQLLTGDFDGALQTITGFIERTISRWKPLFEEVINAIKGLIAPFVNDVISDIEFLANGIADLLSNLPGVDVGGNFSFGRLDEGGGGTAGGTPGGRGRPIARTANGQGVSLDGRTLTESTGRYRRITARGVYQTYQAEGVAPVRRILEEVMDALRTEDERLRGDADGFRKE